MTNQRDFLLEKWLVVIPARLNSQRLPRKPLADLGGKPLIVRVLENLLPLRALGAELICAADSVDVIQIVERAGFSGHMTSSAHESGTDRCAEVARKKAKPYVLNVQGDEPFVHCDDLTQLCQRLESIESAQMGTLVYRSHSSEDFFSPHVVKVAASFQGEALYFSRAPIPYHRDKNGFSGSFLQHFGVYAYRSQDLLRFAELKRRSQVGVTSVSLFDNIEALEDVEKLEQLRALQSGWRIILSEAKHPSRGIDTPEDLKSAQVYFRVLP